MPIGVTKSVTYENRISSENSSYTSVRVRNIGVRLTPAYADAIANGFEGKLAGDRAGEEPVRWPDLPGHLWAAGQFTSASRPANGANNQASVSLRCCPTAPSTFSNPIWTVSAAVVWAGAVSPALDVAASDGVTAIPEVAMPG